MTAVVQGHRPIRVDGLRRSVADLRRSIDFYCGGLGFAVSRAVLPTDVTVRVRLGAQYIDLVASERASPSPADANAPDPRFQHAAIVTSDMDAAWRRLEASHVLCITRGGPQLLPAHTGGVTAVKFRDPDGHPLELIRFPPGTGDPRWQMGGAGGPTLGIDHFALVVADVDSSTAFLTAQLHLHVTGRDINRGAEQDRLDGLDDVEVDVVSLEPRLGPRTPHLELLHYRRPAFSAPIEPLGAGAGIATDEIVCLGERRMRSGPRAIRLRDPDGHRFLVDA